MWRRASKRWVRPFGQWRAGNLTQRHVHFMAHQAKPVSSAAVFVPENARVNNETLTITVLFTNFS